MDSTSYPVQSVESIALPGLLFLTGILNQSKNPAKNDENSQLLFPKIRRFFFFLLVNQLASLFDAV